MVLKVLQVAILFLMRSELQYTNHLIKHIGCFHGFYDKDLS